MILLYHGSGSLEIQLLSEAMEPRDWSQLSISARRLLQARKHSRAAQLLEQLPFELRHGTNWFNDEFCVLYWPTTLERYVEAAEWAEDPASRQAFSQIAETISEIGPFIRFIAVDLNIKEGFAPVESPSLHITTDVVERALRDAEQLLQSSGAVSGLDRVHTALHGYLKAICERHSIVYPKDSSITVLFRLLREQHPALASGAQDANIDRVLKSLAVVIDALNPLRNRGSMAHANVKLLQEPEAMLVINCVRTLLHYFNAKLS